MDEMPGMIRPDLQAFPRTRGGDPLGTHTARKIAAFSPHTRG